MSDGIAGGALLLAARRLPAPPELAIDVVASLGTGRTELSAFDDALFRCGVHNYNLIPLSSVIPPCATVTSHGEPRSLPPSVEHGDRLYVVRAEQRSHVRGTAIACGVGWFQWGDGRGLFVEHEAESTVHGAPALEQLVAELIRASLEELAERRGLLWDLEAVRTRTISGVVADRPLCALTLAVFESEGWRGFSGGAGREAAR